MGITHHYLDFKFVIETLCLGVVSDHTLRMQSVKIPKMQEKALRMCPTYEKHLK